MLMLLLKILHKHECRIKNNSQQYGRSAFSEVVLKRGTFAAWNLFSSYCRLGCFPLERSILFKILLLIRRNNDYIYL